MGAWGMGDEGDEGAGGKFLSSARFLLHLCLFSMPNAQCPMPNDK
ncbi:MAG: hypothetical protein V7L05_24845 [Nostoc sp.]